MISKRGQDFQNSENQQDEEESQESYQISAKNAPNAKKLPRHTPHAKIQPFLDKFQENSKSSFNEEFVEKLNESKHQLDKFMSQLGPILEKNLPDMVLRHIGRKSNPHKTLNYNSVRQFAKLRVEKQADFYWRMVKNKRIKKNWTNEDLSILIWVVAKYCQSNLIKDVYYGISESDWQHISAMIPSSTGENCMFKWLSLKKIKREDLQWKKKQEEILMELAKDKESQNEEIHWNEIAKNLFYRNGAKNKIYRGGKQCRERWNCFLNPKIKKGLWQKEQDIKLIKMIFEGKGQKKWSRLVPHFGGRTENALKNRYHLLIDKELRIQGNEFITTETQLLEKFLQRNYIDNFFPGKKPDNKGQTVESSEVRTSSNFEKKMEMVKEEQISENLEEKGPVIPVNAASIKVIQVDPLEIAQLTRKINENSSEYFPCRYESDGVFYRDYSPK